MNTPVLGYILRKMASHKKKLVVVSVFYILYKFEKLKHINTLLKKIINMVMSFLIKRIKTQSLKTQKALEARLKVEIAVNNFVSKGMAKNREEIDEQLSKLYPTDELLNDMQTQKLDPETKKRKFEELIQMISAKVFTTIVTQYFFDVKHLLLAIIKNNENKDDCKSIIKVPGNLERSTSQEDVLANLDTQPIGGRHVSESQERTAGMDVDDIEANSEYTSPTRPIKDFSDTLFDTISTDFSSFITANFVDKGCCLIESNKKISLEEVVNVYKTNIDKLFYNTQGNLAACTEVNKDDRIVLKNNKFQLKKCKKPILRSLKEKLLYITSADSSILYNQFFQKYRGMSLVHIDDSELTDADDRNLIIDQANFILDFIGSSYFLEAARYSAEYQLNKLFNRLAMYFRKVYGDDSLFASENMLYGAKILIAANSILNEEFYSRNTFLMEQQVLEKRLKFALFIIKKNDPKNEAEQADNAPNDELNCTLVRTVDPYSHTAQFATYLAMREKLAFEMFLYVLRDFFKQTVNCN